MVVYRGIGKGGVMETTRTKSLRTIEEKMHALPPDSLRYQILESTKQFKTSWVRLGQSLYAVWKDKLYKGWGFSTFDTYTAKEIGIRTPTAMKLLRSYYFLEKEESVYLKEEYTESAQAKSVPSLEAIDVLRRAKNKKGLDTQDYDKIKKEIFQDGKDAALVRKDLTALIRQQEELAPEEAYEKKRLGTVRRFLGTLKSLKKEIEVSKLLPAPIIRDAAALIKKLEEELS